MTFDPEDPRLTAFALGELEEADRLAVEAILAEAPEARQYVQEIEATSRILSEHLGAESIPALTLEHRLAIEDCLRPRAKGSNGPPRRVLLAAAAGLILTLGGFGLGRITQDAPASNQLAFRQPSESVARATADSLGEVREPLASVARSRTEPEQPDASFFQYLTPTEPPQPAPDISEEIRLGEAEGSIALRTAPDRRSGMGMGMGMGMGFSSPAADAEAKSEAGDRSTHSRMLERDEDLQIINPSLLSGGLAMEPAPEPESPPTGGEPLPGMALVPAPARSAVPADPLPIEGELRQAHEQAAPPSAPLMRGPRPEAASEPSQAPPTETPALAMVPLAPGSPPDPQGGYGGFGGRVPEPGAGQRQTPSGADVPPPTIPPLVPAEAEPQPEFEAARRGLDLAHRFQSTPRQRTSGQPGQSGQNVDKAVGEPLSKLGLPFRPGLIEGAGEQDASALAISPDGQLLASTDPCNRIKILDINTNREVAQIEQDEPVQSVAISLDNNYLAVTSADQTVGLWSLNEGLMFNAIRIERGPAPQVRFGPQGELMLDGRGLGIEPREPTDESPFIPVDQRPLSTFPTDLDNASSAEVRLAIEAGRLPPPEAVRIEELINAFAYDDPEPEGDAPFSCTVEMARAPWRPEHRLLRIGLKGSPALPGEGEPVTLEDIEVQVEFNPARVESYRWLGAQGQSWHFAPNVEAKADPEVNGRPAVTALYEIVPRIEPAKDLVAQNMKYQRLAVGPVDDDDALELLTVTARSQDPEHPFEIEHAVLDNDQAIVEASADLRFASAVAAVGMLLRDSPYKGTATFETIQELAGSALGDDPDGERGEFIELIRQAQPLAKP
ncbi:hypothetical protein BH23PLA1_BH23PLA1_24280 [soil metagenome]